MKIYFFLSVCMFFLSCTSEPVEEVFTNKLTGEQVQWTKPNLKSEISASGKEAPVKQCRCYQGADASDVNAGNNPQGSCCHVPPGDTRYPYCSNGCI